MRRKRHWFGRSSAWLFGTTAVFGCAGTAKQANETSAPIHIDEPEPESAEWLFATRGTSGARADECRQVVTALVAEENCGGSLCRHAVLLGKDWLRVCERPLPAELPRVKALVAKLEARQSQPSSSCETEAATFTSRGCTEAEACVTTAQDWATRCGDKYGTPLIMAMFEREVGRVAQGSGTKLDPRGCGKMFEDVTRVLTCDNDFDCNDKVTALEKYRARCETKDVPISLDSALRQGRVYVAAGRVPGPMPVETDQFPKDTAGVRASDGRALILGLNGKAVADVRTLMKTLEESEHVQEIQVARVFRAKRTMYELRFGTLHATNATTFYRRFPSFRPEGGRAALEELFEQDMIREISEALNQRGNPAVARRHIVKALQTPGPLMRSDNVKRVFRDADARLAPVFADLGNVKARWLRGMGGLTARVPATRRSIDLPFADLDESGALVAGAATEAVFAELKDVFPQSLTAYLTALQGAVAEIAAIDFSSFHEAKLGEVVTGTADRCVQAKNRTKTNERALLDCALQAKDQKECASMDFGAVVAELDARLAEQEKLRKELKVHFVSLRASERQDPSDPVLTCFAE